MTRASLFEWHKRFKEGRESVRDDERCGRSKKVRTPELIGQIKNFMDKDRCVTIEAISAQFVVNVGTILTINSEEVKMQEICVKLVPRVLREDKKERRCHGSRKMVKLINSDPAVLDALVTCDEKWIYCFDPDTKRQNSQWKHAGSPRPKKARQSKSTRRLLMIPFIDSTGMLYMHWVQEEIPSEEASTLQIGSVAFPPGQCSSPQLHPCHRLFDQDGHQDSSSPSL